MSKPSMSSADTRQDVAAPLHHQVYSVLRQQIIEGHYAAGHPMPSEHQLEKIFSVSRITVRRALDRLASDGLIVKRHGKGTFAQPAITPPAIHTNLRGMLENLVAMGLKTKVEILEFGYLAAPIDVAAKLGLQPGERVQRAVRVRTYEGAPFSYLTTWVPEIVGRAYDEADMLETPLLSLFERSGIVVTEAEQSISAKLADTQTSSRLGVDLGAALLSLRRLVRDQKGQPVELLEALYRPDMYEYQMKMERKGKKAEFIWSDDRTISR
jgi:GntR family transcriptional regulator